MLLSSSVLRLRNLVILLVVSTIFAPASFALNTSEFQTAQRAARPFPAARYLPDRNFDTRHIALNLHFDWEREQVIGTETIVLAPLVNDLTRVELDAANMTFSSVKLNSRAALKYETSVPDQKVRITLDRPYQPSQELTLSIDYHTNGLQDRIIGLTGGGIRFIKPTAEDPKRPKQIWSQGESEYNHYWFPCYDHPND